MFNLFSFVLLLSKSIVPIRFAQGLPPPAAPNAILPFLLAVGLLGELGLESGLRYTGGGLTANSSTMATSEGRLPSRWNIDRLSLRLKLRQEKVEELPDLPAFPEELLALLALK